MKTGLKVLALVTLTLTIERLLGHPGVWVQATAVLLPMPWVIGPPLLDFNRRWYWLAFPLGLGWDLFFEPVIGIGAIAWSVPALFAWFGTSIISDRKIAAWFAFGAGGTVGFWLIRSICYLPLSLPRNTTWTWIGISALLTGLWCALIHGIITLDFPTRWRQRRAHRLR